MSIFCTAAFCTNPVFIHYMLFPLPVPWLLDERCNAFVIVCSRAALTASDGLMPRLLLLLLMLLMLLTSRRARLEGEMGASTRAYDEPRKPNTGVGAGAGVADTGAADATEGAEVLTTVGVTIAGAEAALRLSASLFSPLLLRSVSSCRCVAYSNLDHILTRHQ